MAGAETTDCVARRADETLVFDTETSDLPSNWHHPASDVDNWPRIVQIAWIVCDPKFRPKRKHVTLIRPDGWEVAPRAERVHGIPTQMARAFGAPVAEVLPAFDAELRSCGLVVAHNLEFDQTIMTAEFIRAGLPQHFDAIKGFCTMRVEFGTGVGVQAVRQRPVRGRARSPSSITSGVPIQALVVTSVCLQFCRRVGDGLRLLPSRSISPYFDPSPCRRAARAVSGDLTC